MLVKHVLAQGADLCQNLHQSGIDELPDLRIDELRWCVVMLQRKSVNS
jgi:hypothetical protein